jgi:hypothetical protein
MIRLVKQFATIHVLGFSGPCEHSKNRNPLILRNSRFRDHPKSGVQLSKSGEKPTNKTGLGCPEAESAEGRGLAKGNTDQQNARRTPSRISGAPSALDRVREAARKDKKTRFTALLHHVNIEQLRKSYFSLKRKAAPGVDGVTWEQYGENLEENLRGLHNRVHKGAYRAKATRRTYIPKSDGRQRPLGIATVLA